MSVEKILVTGATGFLGHFAMDVLRKKYGAEKVVGVSTRDADLMELSQARGLLEKVKPDVVVHLAAYSGGIGANRAFPADFYLRNTLLTANMFEAAAKNGGIKKFLYTMGGCSYPGTAKSPIDESQMWQGYPQKESAGYSAAKKMGIVAAQSYKDQYGLKASVLIPGNMYGEWDNFSLRDSHVVPAMIRKYFEAKRRGDREVPMWGSGAPVRDFVYAGDVAATLPYFIENYDEVGPVNLSSGTTTSIKELAETIKELLHYDGAIAWDSSKPDGQMIKIFDVTRMKGLGLSCPTPLREGLKKTIAWFERAYDRPAENSLRL